MRLSRVAIFLAAIAISILIAFNIIVSGTNQESAKVPNQESAKVPNQESAKVPDNSEAYLVEFLGKDLSEEFKQIVELFTSAKTDIEFAKAYSNAKLLIPKIEDQLKKMSLEGSGADKDIVIYNKLDIAFPKDSLFKYDVVSEGTVILPYINDEKLMSLAKTTRGTQDDQFMELRSGGYDDPHSIFYQSIGHYTEWTLFGNNVVLDFLKKSSELLQKLPLFKAEVKNLRDFAIYSIDQPDYFIDQDNRKIMMNHGTVYIYSKELVLDEIRAILKANVLDNEERIKIEAILRKKKSKSLDRSIYRCEIAVDVRSENCPDTP